MKKQNQLGMNPSTASGRLIKDLLFKYVSIHHPDCHVCGQPLTRDTFSVEHITPWLDSDDPVGLFFDLDNIGFSHHSCNVRNARKPNKLTIIMRMPDRLPLNVVESTERTRTTRPLEPLGMYAREGNPSRFAK